MPGEHLVVVDDDNNLRSMLCASLRHNGFDVTPAAGGREALALVEEVRPNLLVLDVMMPEIDGFDVCRRLRQQGDDTPVLFLTARASTRDKVEGLMLGGDDYLEKPFSLEELVARVVSILRRAGAAKSETVVHEFEDIRLDADAHLVFKAGEAVHLSPTEFNLLRYLLVNQGRVMSKSQILDHVWDFDFAGDGRSVETYIGYLRRKLDTTEPKLIHTVRGTGYTMRVQPS